jgi:hypothetical protein
MKYEISEWESESEIISSKYYYKYNNKCVAILQENKYFISQSHYHQNNQSIIYVYNIIFCVIIYLYQNIN